MSADQPWPEKLPRERRKRERTREDTVAMRKRKVKARKAAKSSRVARRKQRA